MFDESPPKHGPSSRSPSSLPIASPPHSAAAASLPRAAAAATCPDSGRRGREGRREGGAGGGGGFAFSIFDESASGNMTSASGSIRQKGGEGGRKEVREGGMTTSSFAIFEEEGGQGGGMKGGKVSPPLPSVTTPFSIFSEASEEGKEGGRVGGRKTTEEKWKEGGAAVPAAPLSFDVYVEEGQAPVARPAMR